MCNNAYFNIILWRIDALLGNDSVNKFLRRQILGKQVAGRRKHIPVDMRMKVIFYGSAPTLYIDVYMPARIMSSFNLPYAYDYITEMCRRHAEVIQNHENENVRGIGQGEARH
jgi:hypothetical protein